MERELTLPPKNRKAHLASRIDILIFELGKLPELNRGIDYSIHPKPEKVKDELCRAVKDELGRINYFESEDKLYFVEDGDTPGELRADIELGDQDIADLESFLDFVEAFSGISTTSY